MLVAIEANIVLYANNVSFFFLINSVYFTRKEMEIISDGNECRRYLRTAGGVKFAGLYD